MKHLFRFAFCTFIFMWAWPDTSANCLYEEILGTWTVYESARTESHTITCEELGEVKYTKEFIFEFPDNVLDELGNKGTWTLISNVGFEINIASRSYYSTFHRKVNLTSRSLTCDETYPGWSRDKTVRNWSCFQAIKTTTAVEPKSVDAPLSPPAHSSRRFRNDYKLINKINSAQHMWRAVAYPEYEKYTEGEMFQRAGGLFGMNRPRVPAAPLTTRQSAKLSIYPTQFDWRDVNGVNYVSPVRDQGACGSCYAFASTAMIEARIRIETKNNRQDIFSPQDVVDCSLLTEGCNGGFGYLIGGRYGEEQGYVEESCSPYTAVAASNCSTPSTCARTYVDKYSYVGDFFGGCNEAEMIEALVTQGPITAAYMVYDDFQYYSGGVYSHTKMRNTHTRKSDGFDPLEPTNHEVLIVGYGVDNTTGAKFWTVKNSWGASWGENGYFRVLRGVDECGIESECVNATPMP